MSEPLLNQFWHQLPRAYGGPVCQAQLKTVPEDFLVYEQLGFEPSGEGEHRWFYIEKRGSNTQWVAKQLAKELDVAERDIGYSGLKDRQAVTRQWFSAPTKIVLRSSHDEWTVLKQLPHRKKCRRGAHQSNHFQIQLRFAAGVSTEQRSTLEQRWQTIVNKGVPNYFGEQRFGRDGGNLEKLPDFLSGKKRNRDPNQRAMLYSAARGALFNKLVAARLEAELELPDYSLLAGRFDEPTAVQQEELLLLADWQPWLKGLRKAKLEPGRRATWLHLAEPEMKWQQPDVLRLGFQLRRGSYATAVLRELVIW